MTRTSELLEQAAARRDLARRARRLADSLSHDDRERLQAHAEDLEAQATELERQAANVAGQQPQQQQQDAEPKARESTDPKRRP